MADSDEHGQLTFDFGDFSDRETSRGTSSDRKDKDDLTPGLFDPELSEEEEMDAFLQEIHSSENEAGENDGEESAAEASAAVPAAAPAECIENLPAEPESAETEPESADAEPEPETGISEEVRALTPKQMKRAAAAFLASLQPDGLAIEPAVGGRCRAGAAAFWLEKGQITRTVLAEIQPGLDAGSGDDEKTGLFNSLKLARMEREVLEQEIRRSEPELRDGSQLFSEFSEWNYEVSKNPAYRECLQKIRRLERILYHGTRLERLIRTKAASELYLIVPENTVSPDYPLNGCGLVYIKNDLSFELVLPAARQENVSKDNQMRLALNIAASNLPEVLFANGIYAAGSGKPKCGPMPRRRHIRP